MRRIGLGGLTIALLATVAVAGVRAADPPAAQPADNSPSWLPRWFGSSPKPAKASEPAKPAAKPGPARPLKPAEADARRTAEEQMYLRRLEAIDRLRVVAHDTNDDALAREADFLEQQAERVFNRRTAKLPKAALPVAGSPAAEELPAVAAGRSRNSTRAGASPEVKP